jgi:cadmium resistance protein CadD (predicted permease)
VSWADSFIVLEEILSSFTIYWAPAIRLLLILSVLFMQGRAVGPHHRGGS